MRNYLLISGMAIALAGCDLSPDLEMPEVSIPEMFKEQNADPAISGVEPASDGKWKRFDAQASIEEFAWWRMFNDDALNSLMDKAMQDNPTLDVALNRVLAARAAAGITSSDLWPAISVGVGPERSKQSPATQEPNLPPGTEANTKPYTLYNARGTISYELDLFGRKRNLTREAERKAEAEQNNYRAARLSLQAELAQTYFRLAAVRVEEGLLLRMVEAQQESLTLTNQKVEVGASDALALSAVQNDLAATKAQYELVRNQRAKTEHALALLVAIPPSELQVDAVALEQSPPMVPVGMPSSLLERRPDIQAAAEGIAAANARIGVSRTGYFPDISLSATGGFTSGELNDLFEWSNRSWMIGPLAGTVLSQPIFEGGRIAATLAQSDANYKAAVSQYKASVLQAFGEVEDQLSGLRAADERMTAAINGAEAARRADEVMHARLETGYASQLDYLDAKRNTLTAERTKIQALGDQYITLIQLIRALGGSWESIVSSEIPPTATTETPPTELQTIIDQAVTESAPAEDTKPAEETPAAKKESIEPPPAATNMDAAASPAAKPATTPTDPLRGLDGVRVVPEDSAF